MPTISKELTLIRDGVVLQETLRENFDGVRYYRGKLYVHEPRRTTDGVGVNYLSIRKTSIDDNYKLPLPWEKILEGTDYLPEHVRSEETPIRDKAEIALAAADYDGFGKPWSSRNIDPDSELANLLTN